MNELIDDSLSVDASKLQVFSCSGQRGRTTSCMQSKETSSLGKLSFRVSRNENM